MAGAKNALLVLVDLPSRKAHPSYSKRQQFFSKTWYTAGYSLSIVEHVCVVHKQAKPLIQFSMLGAGPAASHVCGVCVRGLLATAAGGAALDHPAHDRRRT
jgi:hypothetical protein